MRWVQRYAPEFAKRWNRFGRPAGQSWRVDETYLKVRGRWVYLYRAVDRAGQTVDFRLGARRDVRAAKAFLTKTIKHQGRAPHAVTLDGYAASHRAVREMKADGVLPEDTKVRSSKYLNNVIEQDHRNVESRTYAGLQTIQERGKHLGRHRAGTSHPQGTIRSRETAPQRYHYARCLGRRPRRMTM